MLIKLPVTEKTVYELKIIKAFVRGITPKEGVEA